MNYFSKLITKSYIEHSEEDEDNIALFFSLEFSKVNPEAKNKKRVYTKNQFFKKLVYKIDSLIIDTTLNVKQKPIKKYTEEEMYEEEEYLKEQHFLMGEEATYKMYLEEQGIPYNPPKTTPATNWDTCNDAEKLITARKNGRIFKDPFTLISLDNKKSKQPLVLRKSKLEFLKTEAIRASNAITVDELDNDHDQLQMDFTGKNISNNLKPQKKEVLERLVLKAFETIKPLGGYFGIIELLNTDDMKRLKVYTRAIISTGELPTDRLPFPKIELPNDFIRKTIHLVYVSIHKKHKKEFVDLVHLFQDFHDTSLTTTNRKFSTYEGTYDNKLKEITY
jgi:hypothetical protein